MERYEITAHKGNDLVYKKTFNKVEAVITEWELRMSGYKTKMTITKEREA